MKITDDIVQQFEDEQRQHGTEVAIHNLLWKSAAEQMNDLGITSIRTRALRVLPGSRHRQSIFSHGD